MIQTSRKTGYSSKKSVEAEYDNFSAFLLTNITKFPYKLIFPFSIC